MALRKIYEEQSSIPDGATVAPRIVKVHRDTETNEYRVRLYLHGKAQEACDYFDTDNHSAVETARTMMSEKYSALPTKATPLPFHGSTSRNFREGTYANRLARKRENLQRLRMGTRLNVTPPNEQRAPAKDTSWAKNFIKVR
ncbi:MAG: hypothetical protein RSE62_03500 [Citrobacter sp.]